MQLVVEGFAREPQPEVSFEPPRAGSLELLGMSPNVRQSISMVSGKVTRQESVQFVYRYRLLVREAGTHRIGPFSVRQGAQSASSPAREVQVAMVPRTDEVHLRLVLPETPVYPGQRVALQIEWSFAAQLRERLHRYRIRSPLFDRGDSFRFLDPPAKSGETELVIETAAGQIRAGIPGRPRVARHNTAIDSRDCRCDVVSRSGCQQEGIRAFRWRASETLHGGAIDGRPQRPGA